MDSNVPTKSHTDSHKETHAATPANKQRNFTHETANISPRATILKIFPFFVFFDTFMNPSFFDAFIRRFWLLFGPPFYCTPKSLVKLKMENHKIIQNTTRCDVARTHRLAQIYWHRWTRTFPLKVTSLLYLNGNRTNLKHQRRASPEDMWISQ